MSTHPTVKVAADLTAITEMAARLEAELEHKASDPLMPGGLAMVSLGNVANLEAWEHQYEASERAGDPAQHILDEDDTWEPPLQTLCFWSEQWRAENDAEYDVRPTIASEAAFIRWALEWAWENEIHWSDFADDIKAARQRMEAILAEGARPSFRGAPCMYDECKGKRLIRKTVPTRDKDGNKAWRLTDWHCPNCKRSWDEESYTRNVYAAIERSHFAQIADDTWATVSRAARRVGRPETTIRTWARRGDVASICLTQATHRWTFVLLEDVLHRDQLARERAERIRAGKRAKRASGM